MADVLSTTHREITKRLDELKPLVEEYARLEAAERALRGIPAAPTAKQTGILGEAHESHIGAFRALRPETRYDAPASPV